MSSWGGMMMKNLRCKLWDGLGRGIAYFTIIIMWKAHCYSDG